MKLVFRTFSIFCALCAISDGGLAQDDSPKQDATAPTEHARTEPVVPLITRRAQQLEAMRREKMRRIRPYRQGRLESGLLWVEQTGIPLLNINIRGFQPRFGGLPTGAGLALGTNYGMPSDTTAGWLQLRGTAAWSLRGYQLYGLQFGRFNEKRHGTSLYADLTYRYFPQEDFFGLGPYTSTRDRTDFTFEQVSYEAVASHSFSSWLHLAGSAGVLQVNTGPGTDRRFPNIRERFDEALAPGLNSQPDFLRLTVSVTADYRDKPGNPHAGGLVAVQFSRYSDWRDHAYTFSRYELDTRHYIPLGSTVRVLALRFYASSDQTDHGARVPFYFQQSLGGGDALRGFREYRFRGANILYMSGEYRWEPVRAVELALFYDAGRVFSRPGGLDVRGLRKAAGAGIRFKTSEQTVLRVDTARGDEGTRVYFKFGRSF